MCVGQGDDIGGGAAVAFMTGCCQQGYCGGLECWEDSGLGWPGGKDEGMFRLLLREESRGKCPASGQPVESCSLFCPESCRSSDLIDLYFPLVGVRLSLHELWRGRDGRRRRMI